MRIALIGAAVVLLGLAGVVIYALVRWLGGGSAVKWPACERCLWLWRHRTKTIGGLGIAAGAVQYQLASHPEVHLPHQGTILMLFGTLVALVGTYNSVAEFFGWHDAAP